MLVAGAILASLPLFIGIYAYALYPAILRALAARRPTEPPASAEGSLPLVTIVIPAYN